ncbi:hypothetical protein C8R44DRAFT_849345 [Mycena epipterygia]|nr:hypothetical protein C8R44DRAFT_849345 [Mycena epipterygia]
MTLRDGQNDISERWVHQERVDMMHQCVCINPRRRVGYKRMGVRDTNMETTTYMRAATTDVGQRIAEPMRKRERESYRRSVVSKMSRGCGCTQYEAANNTVASLVVDEQFGAMREPERIARAAGGGGKGRKKCGVVVTQIKSNHLFCAAIYRTLRTSHDLSVPFGWKQVDIRAGHYWP